MRPEEAPSAGSAARCVSGTDQALSPARRARLGTPPAPGPDSSAITCFLVWRPPGRGHRWAGRVADGRQVLLDRRLRSGRWEAALRCCAKASLSPRQGPRRALNVPSWRWRRGGADDLRGRAHVMRADLERAQKQAKETLRQAAREGLRGTRGLVARFLAAWRGDWGAIGR